MAFVVFAGLILKVFGRVCVSKENAEFGKIFIRAGAYASNITTGDIVKYDGHIAVVLEKHNANWLKKREEVAMTMDMIPYFTVINSNGVVDEVSSLIMDDFEWPWPK